MSNFGRGAFSRGGLSSTRGSSGFDAGGASTSNADNQESSTGFSSSSTRGGRGGFNADGDNASFGATSRGGGNFGGGRGGGRGGSSTFGDNNQDGISSSFGRGGGRGGGGNFGPSSGEGGNFGGGRGGGRGGSSSFGDNNQDGSNAFASSRGGRGASSFGGGRGGGNFGTTTTGDENNGGFSSSTRGGRGGFNATGDNASFGASSRGGGNFGTGRGGGRGGSSTFGDNNQDGTSSSFGRGGGRGGGGNFGSAEGNAFGSSRGNFGGRGGGRDGSSSFGDNNQDGSNTFASSRGGRGASSFGGGRGGGNFGTTGDDNQDSSAFGSNRGGNFSSGRGGGRGNFGQNSEGGDNQENAGFGRGGGRGGFNNGGGRGGGRGGFGNDISDAQDGSSRGGFGAGRGRGNYGQTGENQDNGGGFASRGGRGNYGGGRGNFGGNNDENQEGNGFQSSNRGGRGGYGNRDRDAEGGNTGEQRERNAPIDGETTKPERAPINFVPQARNVDDLYAEDQSAATDYADVVDHDEDIKILNFTEDMMKMSNWEEAELETQLITNIKERSKYIRPRKIQSATIPFVLDNFDVKSQAETGSGKTAAFIIPILDACMKAKKATGEGHFVSELACPYAIIIGPTRELVLQVYEQAEKFANDTGISVAKAYGQYNISQNHQEIRAGCDILVATPGRLKQFVTNAEVQVKKLKILVLDEADRLLDESFSVDIMDIVNTPGFPDKNKRQTLLFSATFPPEVKYVADQLLKPEAVFITNERNNPNKRIKQDFVVVERQKKLDTLAEILKAEAEKAGGTDKIRRTLLFVNTKRMSDMAALFLCQQGIPATSINGDRGQHLREEALSDFRAHKVAVLCATDVCARGIDVKQLDHVINYELPQDAITYVHRIGRTGRIAQGYATTFIEGGEPLLREVADMMKENGEEVPEKLQSALDGNVGNGGGGGFTSFTPDVGSSNFVPPATTAAASSSVAAAPAVAASDADDDW